MVDQVFVQHRFTDPVSGFADALVLPKDEYDRLKPKDIEDRKAARIAAHKALMEEVRLRPPPTAEEIAAAREQERLYLEARLAELSPVEPVEVV